MFDAAIIGAGPAGTVAAIGLARLGYNVVVFCSNSSVGSRFDRLAPQAIELLKGIGLLTAAERALVSMPTGSRIRWHSEQEASTPESLYIVDRDVFDECLTTLARRAGVAFLSARASRPLWRNERWMVSGGPAHLVEARFIIDAAGRSSNQPRTMLPTGPATAALCGVWASTGFPEMRTEAAHNSWIWGAPVSGGYSAVSVFLPRQHCAGLSAADREVVYRGILRSTELFRGCLRGILAAPLVVRDATPRANRDPVSHHSLSTGDACLAVDPLVSQGLQIATRLSLHATAVCHTLLSGTGAADAAVEFFRWSQRATLEQHRGGSARLYAEHRTHADERFWKERSRGDDHIQPVTLETAIDGNYRLSPLARIALVPALTPAGVIDHVEGFLHSSYDRPVAYLAGVSAGLILRAFSPPAPVVELRHRCARFLAPEQASRVLDDLLRNGVLVPAAG